MPWSERAVHNPEEFWAKTQRVGPCLEFMGHRDISNRTRVWYRGESWWASRLAWTLARGPIPPGLFVCHTCDNGACVDPLHMFLGTSADNTRDRLLKGRGPILKHSGELHHHAKLTAQDVREIRQLVAAGLSHAKTARRFGVAKQTVTKIVLGQAWKSVA